MAQRLGGHAVSPRLGVPVRDRARLQQGDQPQPPAEQLEHGVAQPGGDADDLRRVGQPRRAMIRPGLGVAQGGQRRRQRVVVAAPSWACRTASAASCIRRGSGSIRLEATESRAVTSARSAAWSSGRADLASSSKPICSPSSRLTSNPAGPPPKPSAARATRSGCPACLARSAADRNAARAPARSPAASRALPSASAASARSAAAAPASARLASARSYHCAASSKASAAEGRVPGPPGVVRGGRSFAGAGPGQVEGDLRGIHVTAAVRERGQDRAGAGVQLLPGSGRDDAVDRVADEIVPEPALAGFPVSEQARRGTHPPGHRAGR